MSVYIATSLDGFIARKDGGMDWLDEANAIVPQGEDLGFQAFIDSVDAMIMGRKTYEMVLSFDIPWPYGRRPVAVLSRGSISFPPGVPDTVTHSSGPPRDLLKRLSDDGAQHVYVDGGTTIQGFLAEGLVDEITVTVIPIVLGDGIPLFGPTERDINLTHVRTIAYDFGFVQSTYSVAREGGQGERR